MKVSLKSVLKSSQADFECFQEQQIIFRAGNQLCIREIARGDCQFISLQRHIDTLYDYKVANNRKGVFTAEKHGDSVDVCHYSLSSERKAFSLTNESLFFAELESLELLIDEYDNALVYGAAKTKDTSSVFLLDIVKMKIMTIGFLPTFEDIKIDGRENMSLSLCGYSSSFNYVKSLRYGLGQWQITEQAYKKVQDLAIQHELLMGARTMFVTRAEIFIFEENDLLQTINLAQGKRSIMQVLKLPKAIVVRFDDDTLKLLFQDNDEITYLQGIQLQLNLLPHQRISKMQATQINDQVIIRTNLFNIYTWRCENLSSTADRSQLIFNRVYNSCTFSKEGSISISTGKRYCLLIGPSNATIWSIQRNQIVLSTDFARAQQHNKKVILAGVINPDGNSILLAFQDKVRLYSILFTKLKLTAEFNIKRCQNIVYSHGGQLAACRYGKTTNSCVTIINMLRSVEICTFKIQAQPRQFLWNQMDDELVVSTEANTVQIYRIAQAMKTHHIKIPEDITQVRIDYKTKHLIVSSQKEIFFIEAGKIIERCLPPIDNFYYMYPLYNMYFIATKSGELAWSHTHKFDSYHEIPLFSNKPFQLVCRNSNLLAFSSFQDITVLQCERNNPNPLKNRASQDLVMIERDQIISFFDKVKLIESNFEILANAAQIKVEEEKNKYQSAIVEHKAIFEKEIWFLNHKLAELSMEKLKQEKENEKVFESLQFGQIKNITELEKMYDRKFEIEKERYLNLQQDYLQQKLKYEKLVLDVEAKYHSQVGQVRNEYSSRFRQECSRLQEIKSTNLEEKKRLEMKFIDLQEENEVTLCEMQNNNDTFVYNMHAKYTQLEEEYEKAQIQIHNQRSDLARLTKEAEEKKTEAKLLREKVQSFENRVALLEKEIARKNTMIEERNQMIEEQAHQIGGLQKAKYVLSFRTTQIRKQLQPKQEQVDKLKSQMFKLQEQYKQQKKKNTNLSHRVQKLQRINEIDKRSISDIKISLKHKQRLYQQLCSQIFTIVNNFDPKEWNNQLISIYKNYIKVEKYENKAAKKKDDTSEEINRHLIHVEESLMQVTSGTEKMLKGKEKEVMRKMKENSELVYQLNVMRKKENQFIKEKKELSSENARLKRELNDTIKTTSRSQTNYTGFTRRVAASRQGNRQKSLNLQIHQLQKSKADLKSSRVQRNRLVSARRTLLVQDQKKQKQSRIFDIARELQNARNTIKRQDRMIEQLNQRLLGAPQDL